MLMQRFGTNQKLSKRNKESKTIIEVEKRDEEKVKR